MSLTSNDIETIRIHMNAIKEKLCNQSRWIEAEEYQRIVDELGDMVPVVRCKDCKWYGDGYLCYNTETLGMQPDDYCSLAEREEE